MKKPLVIAHRGARAHAPENTLAAARLAHAAKADMWELDTCLTKDGQLVVIHDDTLERTTDVAKRPEFADRAPWPVDGFTLEEIRTLDAGSWFGETDPFKTVASGKVDAAALASYKGEKIPTLEEALRLTKDLGWRVNVEIKSHAGDAGHTTVTRKVAALIKELGMERSVIISSFQHSYLREAAELLPQVPRGALVEKPSEGQDPQAGRRAGTAIVPGLTVDEAVAMCRGAEAAFLHPDKDFVDAEFVRAVQDKGFGVNIWTVNSSKNLQRAIGYGVYGIITDYPARLREMLE
ncbi:Glycerophosphoryl diester phosphodiesterase family protein [uncultured delta proteobacterium]|uniref:Glycerophosphoryl diester phosphodiesterase family protein n=1 Tax=uncultured delta proteobacterium TaxID=34034 RepID=A0A212K699_9DELT|nr:Glycerophosphoryl diester phosphodiesterase family protein [uncultured delta proteobacterium]